PGPEAVPWSGRGGSESGRMSEIPADQLEAAFRGAFRGRLTEERRFLGGETIGSLLDRVLPALDRLVADPAWDVLLAVLHGAVNRAILSYALTGGRALLGGFEQAPGCLNVVDLPHHSVGPAVNVTPADLLHRTTRMTTMEELFAQYRPV